MLKFQTSPIKINSCEEIVDENLVRTDKQKDRNTGVKQFTPL